VTGKSYFNVQSAEDLARISKNELVELILKQNLEGQRLIQNLGIKSLELEQKDKEYADLKGLYEELKQKYLILEGQHVVLKSKFFGKGKSKGQVAARDKKRNKGKNKNKPKRQLPSERYPNAPLIEKDVEFAEMPICSCCNERMTDSGMTEDTETVSVIPAHYIVVRVRRHKYRCGKCHGDIKTAPTLPSIKPGSILSDELMIDVALSKYCDLIPIERYSSIAGRGGLKDLPPPTLITSTHYLADFVMGAYQLTKEDVLSDKLVQADETTHLMLEGDDRKHWRLWGFLNCKGVYFEIKNTRSGSVATSVLSDTLCSYLLSDAYCGYGKAIKDINKIRKENGLPPIQCLYCNAHAIRKFKEAKVALKDLTDPELEWFISQYKEIYDLDELSETLSDQAALDLRKKMKAIFEKMKSRAELVKGTYPKDNAIEKALGYFLDYYDGLTLFTTDSRLPIDNNAMERQLRNPVVGRKTWLGTHSRRGAETAAVLFTLVESCKMLGVNPREYFKVLISELHAGKPAFSPYKYHLRQSDLYGSPKNPPS
jgi:transposase